MNCHISVTCCETLAPDIHAHDKLIYTPTTATHLNISAHLTHPSFDSSGLREQDSGNSTL